MRTLLVLVVATAAAVATDLDPLPSGATARLGATAFRGQTALSPDGEYLVIPGYDAGGNDWIDVIDVATGGRVRKLEDSRGGWYPHMRFVGPDLLLATGSRETVFQARTWNVRTGKAELVLDTTEPVEGGNRIRAVTFSADAARCVFTVSQPDGSNLRHLVWQTSPPKRLHTLTPLHTAWQWAKLSADGTTVITGGSRLPNEYRTLVQFWDAATGKEVRRFEAAGFENANQFAVSPDGKRLAVFWHESVRVWDAATAKELGTAQVKARHGTLTFADDGRKLILAGWETVAVLDPSECKMLGEYPSPFLLRDTNNDPDTVAFPGGGKPIVHTHCGWADAKHAELWELETGKALLPFAGHLHAVLSLRFTPDGRTLRSLDSNSVPITWDVATAAPVSRKAVTLTPDFGPRFGVALSPDATRMLWGDRSGTVLWDVTNGKRVASTDAAAELIGPWGPTPVYSPDGKRFVLPSGDYYTEKNPPSIDFPVRDGATGQPLWSVPVKDVSRVAAAFTPDNKRLVVFGLHPKRNEKGEVAVWDVETKKELRRTALPDPYHFVAASPDGRTAYLHGLGVIAAWDADTGTVRRAARPEIGNWGMYPAVPVVSPDGRLLAVNTADGGIANPAVLLVETATLTVRARLKVGGYSVTSTAFSPDGRALAVGLKNGSILLFDPTPRTGPRPWEKAPTPADDLWTALADPDAAVAWPAVRELAHRPQAALALLAERVKPVAPADKPTPERLAALVAQLAATEFRDREAATAELGRVGRLVLSELTQAAEKATAPESQERLSSLLAKLSADTPDERRERRAVEVLEHIGSADAKKQLAAWAKAAPATVLHREATAAAGRVAAAK